MFKIFRSGPVETVALRGLDLRVERGEHVAVLGRSGSGKSTFIRARGGARRRPRRARCAPSAARWRGSSDGELARYRAGTVAVVFQSDNLWSGLTARENVACRCGSRERRTPSAERTARSRGSGSSAGRIIVRSAVWRRAATRRDRSRGRAWRPLVLADEPTGELDAANERVVLDSLALLRDVDGATIVTVTHSLRVADAADRVLVFVDGRVVDELSP